MNDAPALNLDADSSTIGGVDYLTAFTDGGPAVAVVDTDVLITDSDDTELTSATVTLTNPDTDDVLLFNGTPPPGITASVYDPVTGILTLTGTASLAAYQTALQQITFDNTGTNPSTETRIIDVVVNDGTVASNLAHAIIEVTQVNNSAPVVDLDADDSTVVGTSFRATFTEGGAPIPIADIDTLITDADSTTLASATITLTDPQIGDLLTATLPLPGGITASAYDPVTGTLTLSNVASLADYETALEAIRFSAAGDNPVAGSRIVEVVVNDGVNNSQAATALLTVVAVNDAPALVVADATYQEDAVPVLLSPSASLTDVDDTELDFAAVQITAGSFPGDGDTLTVDGATSGTRDWHHVPLGPHTACVGPHRCEFGRELSGAAADRPISIDEPQSHRLRRESATDPDLVRIGWHGRHDRNDDTRYRCRAPPETLPTTIRRWRSPTRSPPPRTP